MIRRCIALSLNSVKGRKLLFRADDMRIKICTCLWGRINSILKIDVSLYQHSTVKMKDGILKYGLLAAFVTILAAGCAKQAAPVGGPKDTTPPDVVKSVPASGTTLFKAKSILITFNEYFVLDKLNEKFMISPPVKVKPKIYSKDKILHIDFKEDLKDSTTYTLYFQDIIRDLNENNPIPNFQYVFSTGNVLDSLSVTGNVLFAGDLEPAKNILLMLYANLADSAPVKILPDYLTVADVNGYFRINNIKTGKYRLYALSDNNSNNKYDTPDETFAFLDSVIDVNPVKDFRLPEPEIKDTVTVKNGVKVNKTVPFKYGDHKLFLFNAEKKAHYLTSSDRKMPFQFMYCLSLPPDTMKFDFRIADNGNNDYFTEKNRTGDTITVWLRDSSLYSQPDIKTIVHYPFTDSTGKNIYRTDSIPMRYTMIRAGRGKQKPATFKLSSNISPSGLKPGQKIVFSSATPFRPPDTAKIRLYRLVQKDQIAMPVTFSPDTTTSRNLFLNVQLKEGENYLFIRNKGSFGDIYGNNSDSSGTRLMVREPNSYGHLTMDVRNGTGDLIIQLLSEREIVLEQRKLKNSGLADFPLLERGLYRVRVIYDLNGDGKWTTGNYELRLQPEPVSYFPREIEVKTDWEIIEEWDVTVLHSKEKALREKKETGG
jgi:uncharacterized protein (DUF2141 family)